MANDFSNFFDNSEVISVYSDADALADGVIYNSSDWFLFYKSQPVNRITATAIRKISERCGVRINNGLCGRVGELLETVREHGEDLIIDAPFKLWLIPNEVNGLTLMMPEDY